MRFREAFFSTLLVVGVIAIITAMLPDAIDKELSFKERLAFSRCAKDGDYDDKSPYCQKGNSHVR